jgi:hypothetical protein
LKATPEANTTSTSELIRNTWILVISSRYTMVLRIESKY